jgi:pSer/pThr/pTyr-binding forkhead associated (FHA) protein
VSDLINEELEKLFEEAAAMVDPRRPRSCRPSKPAVIGVAPEPVQLMELPSRLAHQPRSGVPFPESPIRPTMRAAVPILTVLDDGSLETGQEIRIRQPVFTIGRCTGDLVLPNDPAMSAKHAELRLTDHHGLPRWTLHDTGSTNHTFVRATSVRIYPDTIVILGVKRYRLQQSVLRLAKASGPLPEVTCLVALDAASTHPCDALVEICGGRSGCVFPLVSSPIAIGRDAHRCPIHIDDPSLAKLHAEFRHEPDGSWRIVASPSLNGVWVSTRSTRLTSCCYFQCGEQRFRFVLP